MRLRLLKLVLRVGGALLLVVGGFMQAFETFRTLQVLRSNDAATQTLIVPPIWLYVMAVGVALLVGSLFLPRRR